MKLVKTKWLIILSVLLLFSGVVYARSLSNSSSDKKFDLVKYHNVGNIWLRVSNYGFFGSGDDIQPPWPSLEYPGGSGIDYLYQGALWFGAKKKRLDIYGNQLYFAEENPDNNTDVITEYIFDEDGEQIENPDWSEDLPMVVDTLTTLGFDGDADLYEFLPAYNPKENNLDVYGIFNVSDTIMTASIRKHRRAEDDDGDGQIDEDPVGYAFPFRPADELPNVFESYGNQWLSDFVDPADFSDISNYESIWFPLGFVDLADETNENYNFAEVNDDDLDGLFDEDGYPVSEQDFVSFYYDYSPFGTSGERDYGQSASGNNHGSSEQLNIRVRQMSYQWSYDYIKNLVYVEFDITNMNQDEYLYDCAMGIYMDSDVGPQAYTGDGRSMDDISSYVRGEGYEFAYTYDADTDGGLTTGFVGSRVCTPDPDILDFACWYWNRGEGPDDSNPLNLEANPTANQKYWLLTGRNPDDSKYISLREDPDSQLEDPDDTRYLFAFYGDMQGMDNPTVESWNLAPGNTMKIVIAVFPGESITSLKTQAGWAKSVYGKAQNLQEVVEPDTFVHYQAPEPPEIPNVYAELAEDGNKIDVYWDNRSQMDNIDTKTIPAEDIGWQDETAGLDSHIDSFTPELQDIMPEEYWPDNWITTYGTNDNAKVNPWRGDRLRHDFQGYALWGRSGSGSQEYWMLQERWDKVETDQDYIDYETNLGHEDYKYFGGSGTMWSEDKKLPNKKDGEATAEDTLYFRYDDEYKLVNYVIGDDIYGFPLYDASVVYDSELQEIADGLSKNDQALLFKNPNVADDIYLAIYDDRLIPLEDHLGENHVGVDGSEYTEDIHDRLSRRYYHSQIYHPPKGVEYYLAVTAWDRGIPSVDLQSLESGRDATANMKVMFPGPSGTSEMDKIHVVPNPYVGQSDFDGRRSNDEKGDKSRRIWFVQIPERCKIKIFSLAGDLVDVINHDGATAEDIITISKAAATGIAASGLASWDLLSMNNQIIAPGVYLFSVRDLETDEIKVGKFVIIK